MVDVELERDGNVAIVSLAAPERRNALTRAMADLMVEVCDEIDADSGIGAAVIQGKGGQFCAGAHRDVLRRMGEDPAAPDNYDENSRIYGAFMRCGRLEVPVIAAVRGAAVGAGVNLMMAADLRVVADNARVMAGFLRLGFHPGGGHFALVARAAGREAAAALTIFGEEFNGRQMVEAGLAWESIPDEAVEDRARELATRAATDPELSRATIATYRMEVGPPALSWENALHAERATQMWSFRRHSLSQQSQ